MSVVRFFEKDFDATPSSVAIDMDFFFASNVISILPEDGAVTNDPDHLIAPSCKYANPKSVSFSFGLYTSNALVLDAERAPNTRPLLASPSNTAVIASFPVGR